MRIVAGQWRGRPLKAPAGSETRPSSDRAREALFSMLTSRLGSFEEHGIFFEERFYLAGMGLDDPWGNAGSMLKAFFWIVTAVVVASLADRAFTRARMSRVPWCPLLALGVFAILPWNPAGSPWQSAFMTRRFSATPVRSRSLWMTEAPHNVIFRSRLPSTLLAPSKPGPAWPV